LIPKEARDFAASLRQKSLVFSWAYHHFSVQYPLICSGRSSYMNIGAIIDVQAGVANEVQADVLMVKYAAGSSGLDKRVREDLKKAGYSNLIPNLGEAMVFPAPIGYQCSYILIVASAGVHQLDYAALRDLGRDMLVGLSLLENDPREVITTLHGVNTSKGNDEVEAFRALLLGFADAFEAGKVTRKLERITFVEREPHRMQLMRDALKQFFPTNTRSERSTDNGTVAPLVTGVNSFDEPYKRPVADDTTPHVFVAMPFDDAFDDHYYLAIRPAITDNGPLCIRLDQKESVFTGDIMDQVKKRIQTSKLMIALLDDANPNVYLEVGYAWGVGIPTILVLHEEQQAPFDVQGARLLMYKRMHLLKQQLAQEIQHLLKNDG
jgi:hypothetical protein